MLMTLLKRDRRWVFLLMGLCVLLPLLNPVKVPIVPGNPTVKFYEAIEKLPEGSRILVSGDYDPASAPELQPMMMALLDQAFRRNLKVVAMELWPQGPS